jgi:hypothetical protein
MESMLVPVVGRGFTVVSSPQPVVNSSMSSELVAPVVVPLSQKASVDPLPKAVVVTMSPVASSLMDGEARP